MQNTEDQNDPSPGDAGRAGMAPAPLGEALLGALAFFTRLPLWPATHHPLAATLAGFAPAGALIGLIVGVALAGFGGLGLPTLLAALLAVGCGLILTGALHEDGLADCADALGRADRDQALAIMRDSRLGSFGALALILSVTLRAASLAMLPGWVALAALIGAHSFSRAVLGIVLERLQPARADGLGASAGTPSRSDAMLALAVGAGIAVLAGLLFAGIGASLFALAVAGIVALGGLEVARRRFGGYTGDVLGALQQIVETAMLVAFTAFY